VSDFFFSSVQTIAHKRTRVRALSNGLDRLPSLNRERVSSAARASQVAAEPRSGADVQFVVDEGNLEAEADASRAVCRMEENKNRDTMFIHGKKGGTK